LVFLSKYLKTRVKKHCPGGEASQALARLQLKHFPQYHSSEEGEETAFTPIWWYF
jgi:hypothetical protein